MDSHATESLCADCVVKRLDVGRKGCREIEEKKFAGPGIFRLVVSCFSLTTWGVLAGESRSLAPEKPGGETTQIAKNFVDRRKESVSIGSLLRQIQH